MGPRTQRPRVVEAAACDADPVPAADSRCACHDVVVGALERIACLEACPSEERGFDTQAPAAPANQLGAAIQKRASALDLESDERA